MRRLVLFLVAIVFVGFLVGTAFMRLEPFQNFLMERVATTTIAKNQDELYTDDALRAVVCGSSSPMPDPRRAGPCIAVFAGGRFYVVDVGPGAWRNMALWRVGGHRIGAVLLTHFHSDHIAELGEFNMQTWAAGREAPLRVFGPSGVERVVGGFSEAYAPDISYRTAHHGEEAMDPEVGRLKAMPFDLAGGARVVLEENGLVVRAFTVDHPPIVPSVGYRFEYGGRTIVISGDTVRTQSLLDQARGVDVLFHEAQANFAVDVARRAAAAGGHPQYAKLLGDIPDYHTSPVEAAEIANEVGASLLVLYHLTPPPPNFIAERIFMRGVPRVRSKGVVLARDGLVVELPRGSKDVTTRFLK
jgi:ribonuclease Z